MRQTSDSTWLAHLPELQYLLQNPGLLNIPQLLCMPCPQPLVPALRLHALRCADSQAKSEPTDCLHKPAGYTETGAARLHCVMVWQKGISHPLKRNQSMEVPKTFTSAGNWGVYPQSYLTQCPGLNLWFSALLGPWVLTLTLWSLSPGLPCGAIYTAGLNIRGCPHYGHTALKAWKGKSVHFEGQNVVECEGAGSNIFYDTQALQ